jgi:hypothetical protein
VNLCSFLLRIQKILWTHDFANSDKMTCNESLIIEILTLSGSKSFWMTLFKMCHRYFCWYRWIYFLFIWHCKNMYFYVVDLLLNKIWITLLMSWLKWYNIYIANILKSTSKCHLIAIYYQYAFHNLREIQKNRLRTKSKQLLIYNNCKTTDDC